MRGVQQTGATLLRTRTTLHLYRCSTTGVRQNAGCPYYLSSPFEAPSNSDVGRHPVRYDLTRVRHSGRHSFGIDCFGPM